MALLHNMWAQAYKYFQPFFKGKWLDVQACGLRASLWLLCLKISTYILLTKLLMDLKFLIEDSKYQLLQFLSFTGTDNCSYWQSCPSAAATSASGLFPVCWQRFFPWVTRSETPARVIMSTHFYRDIYPKNTVRVFVPLHEMFLRERGREGKGGEAGRERDGERKCLSIFTFCLFNYG